MIAMCTMVFSQIIYGECSRIGLPVIAISSKILFVVIKFVQNYFGFLKCWHKRFCIMLYLLAGYM